MFYDYRWTTDEHDPDADIYGDPIPDPDHPFHYDTG